MINLNKAKIEEQVKEVRYFGEKSIIKGNFRLDISFNTNTNNDIVNTYNICIQSDKKNSRFMNYRTNVISPYLIYSLNSLVNGPFTEEEIKKYYFSENGENICF